MYPERKGTFWGVQRISFRVIVVTPRAHCIATRPVVTRLCTLVPILSDLIRDHVLPWTTRFLAQGASLWRTESAVVGAQCSVAPGTAQTGGGTSEGRPRMRQYSVQFKVTRQHGVASKSMWHQRCQRRLCQHGVLVNAAGSAQVNVEFTTLFPLLPSAAC